MRLGFAVSLVAGLLLAGCGDDGGKPGTKDAAGTTAAGAPSADGAPGGPGGPPMGPGGMGPGGMGPGGPGGPGSRGPVEMTIPTDPKPVAVTAGVATLTPENSKVEFIGTHAPGAPLEPRLGGFEKISGQAEVDVDSKTLKSISLEIEAPSVWTQVGGPLSNHLKSPDFFDVKEFPTISFKSTGVEATDAPAGKYTLTGDLTLHGVTKPISVPATIKIDADGLTLISQFKIDRTDYGMKSVLERVEKTVSLTVVVGDKTQPKSGAFGGVPRGGPGGGPGGPGGGPPGGFPGGPPGGGGRPGAGGPPAGSPGGGNGGT